MNMREWRSNENDLANSAHFLTFFPCAAFPVFFCKLLATKFKKHVLRL